MKLPELVKNFVKRGFFDLINESKGALKPPSQLMLRNIEIEYLNNILQRTKNRFKVYFQSSSSKDNRLEQQAPPFGVARGEHVFTNNSFKIDGHHSFHTDCSKSITFKAILHQDEAMQFFLQWQRFRKIWWSTITSTPSLFMLSDIRDDTDTSVCINAHFPWASETAETLNLVQHNETKKAVVSSSISLDAALLTVLADALLCQSEDETLKFHRKIAPYKFSFALNSKIGNHRDLFELATLMNARLNKNGLTTKELNFEEALMPLNDIFYKSCLLGIPYTVILTDEVLSTGIFELMNRDTLITEQVHLIFFDEYSKQLFRNF